MKQEVIVTVADEALDEMHEVADRLQAHGFDVTTVLELTGNVTGSWSGSLEDLRKIRGVLDAEYTERSHTQGAPGDVSN